MSAQAEKLKVSAELVFKLFSVFQRKNQFVGRSSNTEFTLLESHLMCEIDGQPDCSVGELLAKSGVEGSMLSRALEALRSRGHIQVRQSELDRRQYRLKLTGGGLVALAGLDRNANDLLQRFTASFTKSEVSKLSSLLLELADGLNAPATATRKVDHPLRQGMRRMARALNIIGTRQFDSAISASQWQVLQAVHEQSGIATATSIQERIGINQSTLSRMLAQLATAGLLKQRAGNSDHRARQLSLSSRGITLISEVSDRGASKIAAGLREMPESRVTLLVGMLEKLVFSGPTKDSLVLEDSSLIRRLETREELHAGRALLVETLVATGRHRMLEEELIPPSHDCFALFANQEPSALCDFSTANKRLTLHHMLGRAEVVTSWRYLAFIKLCFRQMLHQSPKSKLYLPFRERYIMPAGMAEWLTAPAGWLSFGSVPFP
jgi:DNA-binding MarR family transcriptional regulator